MLNMFIQVPITDCRLTRDYESLPPHDGYGYGSIQVLLGQRVATMIKSPIVVLSLVYCERTRERRVY